MTADDTLRAAPAKPSRLRALIQVLVGFGVGFGAMILAITLTRHAGYEPKALFSALDGRDFVLFVLSGLLAVLLHELGHLLGGLAGGMRLLMFAVGPLRVVRTAGGLRFGRHSLRSGVLGFVSMLPDPARPFGPQFGALVAGGPAASLVCALAGLAVALASGGTVAMHASAFAIFCTLALLITAIPMRIGGFQNDGEQVRDLMRGGTGAQLKSMLLALIAQSVSGTRPRDLDTAILTRALELADAPAQRDPALGAFVHLVAGMSADDRADIALRDRHYEAVAEAAHRLPPPMRAQLAGELAYHAARSGRAETAREWMGHVRGAITDAGNRARIDAAIALAEGRHDAARAAIARARAELKRPYDEGGALWARDELDRLVARLPQ